MEMVKDNRVAAIPKGYRWCDTCELLTPHEDCDPCPYQVCLVCGDKNWGEGCPNCGWWDEKLTDTPNEFTLIAHHPGCHFHEDWTFDYENLPFDDIYAYTTTRDFFRDNFDEMIRYGYGEPKSKAFNPAVIRTLYEKMMDVDCRCPRHLVFDHLNTWGHWHHQDSRDGEWSGGFTVRCPVCGEVFDYEY